MALYATGHQSIFNEDGSVTHVSVEREFPEEPLSFKAQVLWTVGTLIVSSICLGAPVGLTMWADRREAKKALRDRQQQNIEIFNQLKPI